MIRRHALAFVAAALCLAAAPAPVKDPRLDLAATGYELSVNSYRVGRLTIEDVCAWSVRLAEASKDWNAHLGRMTALEIDAKKRVETGAAPQLDLITARWFHADAVARAK
jgi:hypothetical protein